MYNTGQSTGRVSVEPGILYKATFEEAKKAIESLGPCAAAMQVVKELRQYFLMSQSIKTLFLFILFSVPLFHNIYFSLWLHFATFFIFLILIFVHLLISF